MLFSSRQKKLQSNLAEYNAKISLCIEEFRKAFTAYCKNSDREELKNIFRQLHKAESMADDIRREIEVMMYTKALFPESRGDILGLLETMDRVPNAMESSVRMVLNQHIVVPEDIQSKLLQLVKVSCSCVEAMLDCAGRLFTDFTSAAVAVSKVDEIESEADHIEYALIEDIFSSEIDGYNKIIFKDLIKHIAEIPDRTENVADRIRIITAKRNP